MRINIFLSCTIVLLSAKSLMAQQNPNEKTLQTQMDGLKKSLTLIDTTLDRSKEKGRFSAGVSDSLYNLQDYLMDLNDRLYWMTNKDSMLNITGDREAPVEGAMDGNDDTEKEIPMPQIDSMPTPPLDWSKLMPKPKVRKHTYFVQMQSGFSFLMDNSTATVGAVLPEWKVKAASNPGGTFIYAIRLGKADVSKLKMEFNIKKKLTTSNFIKASPWQLRFGVGLQRYEIAQTTDLEIARNANKEVVFTAGKNDYKKNTLGVYYVHVPLTIWRRLSGKTYLEVGGFANIVRTTKQTLTYKTDNINNSLVRKGNFGTNNFAYGTSAAIGYGAFAIYANYHLSPLFAKSSAYKYNLLSVGLKAGF